MVINSRVLVFRIFFFLIMISLIELGVLLYYWGKMKFIS